jgi:hypothetical protein
VVLTEAPKVNPTSFPVPDWTANLVVVACRQEVLTHPRAVELCLSMDGGGSSSCNVASLAGRPGLGLGIRAAGWQVERAVGSSARASREPGHRPPTQQQRGQDEGGHDDERKGCACVGQPAQHHADRHCAEPDR